MRSLPAHLIMGKLNPDGLLVMLGMLDSAVVRPPLLPLGDDERAAVRAALERAGLLQGAAVA